MKSIAIIGPMGSGKSTVGHLLSQRLNWPWVDLDEWIEMHEKRSVQKIFQESGEEYFRKLEEEQITLWTEQSPLVISLGGGAPCSPDRWNLVQENYFTLYLQVRESVLLARLENDRSDRPLIADRDDWKEFYLDLLSQRKSYYEKADWILDLDNENPEEVVQRILDHVLQ